MIGAALALALLARGPGNHTQDYSHGALSQSGQTGVGIIGRYLASDGSYQTAGDACSLFSSELTAPSFCLRGDGTSTGSLSLSAVGSPTTQTMAWCGNGLNCGPVSRQLVSASNYYQTASMAQPGGSWWACVRGISDAPLALGRYMGQTSSWNFQTTTTGTAQFAPTGGTTISSSAGAIVGGASQLVCVSWHQVGAGSNVATLYVDGAQVAQSSTEANLASVSTQVAIGQLGGNPISRLGFAMFGTGDPSATLFSRLASATAPTPQGTRGEALSDARASASNVMAPDGVSMTVLQPNRLGASGGAAAGNARTNLATFSEQLDNAAYLGSATATANTATAPDGAQTADTLAGTGGLICRYQMFVSTGGPATISIFGQSAGTSTTYSAELYDNTTATELAIEGCTSSAPWARCSVSVSSTVSTHQIFFRACLNAVGASTIHAWGFQPEWTATPSPYCRSEGTSATCAGDQVTVPTPSGLSATNGCMRACIIPTWGGTNPTATELNILSFNTTQALKIPASSGQVAFTDNAGHGAFLTTTITQGVKRCYLAKWSGGVLSATDLTSGVTTNGAAGFTGFTLGSSIGVGFSVGSSTGQPLGSVISDISFGASAQACN